jgi:hypothetical protein
MAKERRPFNPAILVEFGNGPIKAPIGLGAVAWRYTVLVPIEETKPGENPQRIATREDLANLEITLTNHFDGLTVLPESVGYGLREKQIELNKHAPFVVYTAANTPSDLYFQALRRELEEALAQETILVERHDVWLH